MFFLCTTTTYTYLSIIIHIVITKINIINDYYYIYTHLYSTQFCCKSVRSHHIQVNQQNSLKSFFYYLYICLQFAKSMAKRRPRIFRCAKQKLSQWIFDNSDIHNFITYND